MARLLSVVAAALIDKDGRTLLAQRPEGKSMAGLWEFPGGKIADGETPETALVRELEEELGIETENSCLAPLGFSSGHNVNEGNLEEFHLLILLFVCRKWRGVPSGIEGQQLKWVNPRDLLSYDMPPADRPLATQLRELLCSMH